jgi:hypothetical protein
MCLRYSPFFQLSLRERTLFFAYTHCNKHNLRVPNPNRNTQMLIYIRQTLFRSKHLDSVYMLPKSNKLSESVSLVSARSSVMISYQFYAMFTSTYTGRFWANWTNTNAKITCCLDGKIRMESIFIYAYFVLMCISYFIQLHRPPLTCKLLVFHRM